MIKIIMLLLSLTASNVDVELSQTDIFLGEKTALTLQIKSKDFEVLDADILSKNIFVFEKKIKKNNLFLTVAAYKLGSKKIPVKIYYVTEKGETGNLLLNTKQLNVKRKYPNQEHIRFLKSVENPQTVYEQNRKLIYLGLSLIIILLMVSVLVLNTKRAKSVKEIKLEINASEYAADILDNIKSEQKLQTGDFKHYYDQISDCIRKYLDVKYSITALELTFNELKEILQNREDIIHHNEILAILEEAEDIKFSPLGTAPAGLETIWERTYSILVNDEI